jgi:hypothetical protein
MDADLERKIRKNKKEECAYEANNITRWKSNSLYIA